MIEKLYLWLSMRNMRPIAYSKDAIYPVADSKVTVCPIKTNIWPSLEKALEL